MYHLFDVELAEKYGLNEAIILNNLWFWVEKNRANETNFYDGNYWTYNSNKAFQELMPYLTEKKIRNAINNLIEQGIIVTGNYNTSSYDRTLWYAFTEKGKTIMTKGQMEIDERSNRNSQKGEPIPDINTDVNSDNKEKYKKEKSDREEFEKLWKLYPRKQGKETAFNAYKKAVAKGATNEEIAEGIRRYVEYIKANRIEARYIKHGATWFNQNCWNDEYNLSENRLEYTATDSDYDISNW